jgi:hypothetical protein
MARHYSEETVPAAYDAGVDLGFVPRGYLFHLHAGGPVDYSFDGGTTVAGRLGPAATRPVAVQAGGSGSRVWFDSAAGGETVSVWAWD